MEISIFLYNPLNAKRAVNVFNIMREDRALS